MNIPQLDSTYIANTYARFPVTIARGKGSLVWDADDKVYIDMATGIAVNSFGIADPAWIRAVTEQLCTVQHASNLYYTAPDAQLAQLLCEKTGMKKVFFSNSGAEANECAIKAARKYAADHKGPEYHTIITLKNSFHGRTITTLAATGQDVFHHDFLPLTEGFAYAEANNLDDLKAQVAAHKCAAIMMEVVQGEGGVIPLTQEFVKGAAQLAAEQDLLLICDEVQIGNGRSGMLYGYMAYGVQPDIDYSNGLVDVLNIRHYTFNIHGGTSGILDEMARVGIDASRQTKVNLPSRIRMATLYAIAQSEEGGIVINTSNLSEDWVGYCTIYGDSAGAFSPLGMYTTEEVIALGAELGLPERFLIKPPSDGLTGKTDEDNLGFSYHAVNEYIRKGEVDPAIKEQIDRKHKVSRFKFQTLPVYQNGLPIVLPEETDYYNPNKK